MATTYLTRTPSSAGNRKTFTFSAWLKGHNTETEGSGYFFTADVSGGSNIDAIGITASGLQVSVNSANSGALNSTRLFRDLSAWYHIVWAVDTTQATASNRMKIYVNGVQETAWDTETYPSQNYDFAINGTTEHNVSYRSGYFSGLMTHVYFIDGTAYDASAFGETDTTTGEWKAKTSPSVNYGTNGFLILKDGNTITDQSSNSNAFTLGGGTLTDLKDNPDNVFATMNPLDNYWQGSTFSNGNNTIVTGSTSATFNTSTLMMTSGKFYAEVKPTVGSATLNIGITGEQAVNSSQTLASRGTGYAYLSSSSVYNNGSSVGGTWSTYTNNDIIGIAVDLDNNKLYFSKNGTWQNSGDPTSGSTGTGAVSITDPSNLTGDSKMGAYAFAINETWDDNTRTVQWNFGNGYFGTTAVSSAGTNASDNGIFEYDVPTGYTALSTKGLNE